LVASALEGYNGTVFAYGQTGTGKTYTMLGSEKSEAYKPRHKRSLSPFISIQPTKLNISTKGCIMLGMQDIFSLISNTDRLYTINCSYIEIYNENLYDLLSNENNDTLTINEDPVKGFYIKNLSEKNVRTIDEAIDLVTKGENCRRYGNSDLNKNSSRSHTIFRINIVCIKSNSHCCESLINFVDLAGSERITSEKKISNLETLNEGKHINTSLFYLCQVIYKLSEKNLQQSTHIPYRNSNLTKILRNAIGGNCYTSIICTGSLGFSSYDMTLSTLQIATLAKSISNKVYINIKATSSTDLLIIYQKDIETLKSSLYKQKIEFEHKLTSLQRIQERTYKAPKEYIGWIKGVGDVQGPTGTKSTTDVWKDYENSENLKTLTSEVGLYKDKCKELACSLEDLRSKYSLLQESFNQKKDLIEEFIGSDPGHLFDYIEGLRKKISILEGRGLDGLSTGQLRFLEKFFFKCIDLAKDARFRKTSQILVLGEKNQNTTTIKPIWTELGLDFPSTPKSVQNYSKENKNPLSNN
jgi:centromeric protein E